MRRCTFCDFVETFVTNLFDPIPIELTKRFLSMVLWLTSDNKSTF